jgi:hypothetical protein
MSDKFLDHPILSSRYFYPWPNRFEKPFFVEGNGFRLGCCNQGQLQQENESMNRYNIFLRYSRFANRI